MSSVWPGATTTLSGILIGGAITYVGQALNRRRESRRELYGDFAGECRVWFVSLLRVNYTVENHWENDKRLPHWDRANDMKATVFGLRTQVSLLATRPTIKAAELLERYLESLDKKIYEREHRPQAVSPISEDECKREFETPLKNFLDAADNELRIFRRVRGGSSVSGGAGLSG